jgi:hypothetical protein
MPAKQTQQQIINRMATTHNGVYDYSQVVYTHSKAKVKIGCTIHGWFEQSPEKHIMGTGCPLCKSNKTKQTVMSKYGVQYVTQSPLRNDKAKQTRKDKYGHENAAHGASAKAKIVATNMERYGVPNAAKNKDIQEQMKQTCLERYGYESALFIHHATQLPKHTTLPRLADKEWLYDQYITQGKTAEAISKELGISDLTVAKYLRNAEIDIKCITRYSYKCIKWLDEIAAKEDIVIQHAGNGGEYCIPTTRYKADGYCKETNTIYEFHGDVFHGNPTLYHLDQPCHPFTKETAGVLYQRTLKKEHTIRELGYALIVMWENDYKATTIVLT